MDLRCVRSKFGNAFDIRRILGKDAQNSRQWSKSRRAKADERAAICSRTLVGTDKKGRMRRVASCSNFSAGRMSSVLEQLRRGGSPRGDLR